MEVCVVHHVLIVEDSSTMRSYLAEILEDLEIPVKVTEAASGFEALHCLPRQPFNLVVTDINMPDISGLELVSFIRSNATYRGIPLIIVSSESTERNRQKALALGADAFLVKPLDPELLRDLAADLLSHANGGI